MKQQNPDSASSRVLVDSKTYSSIIPKSLQESKQSEERSRLAELQELIHEQRLTEALSLLEKCGFFGDTALFLLGWAGFGDKGGQYD